MDSAPKTITLPAGNHDEVLLAGPYKEMVREWTSLTDQYERLIVETYAVGVFPVSEVVPVLAYASVARSAYALCSASVIVGGVFDAVAFGRACERIALEQIERYRIAREAGHI